MKASEFESAVFKTDGIKMVIRASKNKEVGTFHYKNASVGSTSLADFRTTRIPQTLTEGLEYEIIDGNGNFPKGNTLIENVRKTYK